MWQPSDMLSYVREAEGTPESVLSAMDRAAETSWMMCMGPAKGKLVEEAVRGRKKILEIGTFLSYMTLRMSQSMAKQGTLTTIEIDDANYDAAVEILKKAGGDRRIRPVHGAFRDVRLQGPFDFVLMDHWKADYARDLDLLVSRQLLADGALIVADNVLFPGAPDLLDYLNVPYVPGTDDASGQPCLRASADSVFTSSHFDTTLVATPFEYRPETPDALLFATYHRR